MAKQPWNTQPAANQTLLGSAEEIERHLQCHPIIATLLWNRGIRSEEMIAEFLKPELSKLPDPFLLKDMKKAAERICSAVLKKQKIVIYGDYDVDGTCGASVLFDFFRKIGIETTVYQPNRFTEGYGVHESAIERLIDQGAEVIITVDCGITSFGPADLCKKRGVDFLVLDHHKLVKDESGKEKLPDAYAVVNPQRPDDESDLVNLCGCGIAFFFILSLRALLRREKYFQGKNEKKEPNLLQFLDLVAVATVADMMDVRGVNRILIKHGLRVLATNPRPGLKAILDIANVKDPTAMHCGFVIGPRINAAGRLESAKAALELLTSEDLNKARTLAEKIEDINKERRKTQDNVEAEARELAHEFISLPIWKELEKKNPASVSGPWPRALVLVNPNWHEGVVGIVASRIVEEFKRPVFILTGKEGDPDSIKGSIRSIPTIDIISQVAAESVSQHVDNFGGHAHAGGVSLKKSKLKDFYVALNEHMAITTGGKDFNRERRFDAEVLPHEVNGRLVEELKMLEPFGQEFKEPIFKFSGVKAFGVRVLKEKHLKLKLESGVRGADHDAIWFNALKNQDEGFEQVVMESEELSMWVVPSWNEWQGRRSLQLRVSHIEI